MSNTPALNFFDIPPVRWVGSKWKLAEWIIGLFPPHATYCEPYAGSAAIFFRKHPSQVEIINDLNGDVVNFFRVLRQQPDELLRLIRYTPVSRTEYEESFVLTDDPLEAARRFYVTTRQSFGGSQHYKTGWRYQVHPRDRGTSITREWQRMEGLEKAAQRLLNAQIEHDDALQVIGRYDNPETLYYVDPPYPLDTRSNRRRYALEMTQEAHERLAERLRAVQGMVILSSYRSALYDALYAGWKVISKSTTTNGNGRAMEYLYINPACIEATMPLFRGAR